jgi:hypothetical protein
MKCSASRDVHDIMTEIAGEKKGRESINEKYSSQLLSSV